ncbi:MAG: Ty1/Copia family ribonuclease HI, partial [Pseudomonadota bacterium]
MSQVVIWHVAILRLSPDACSVKFKHDKIEPPGNNLGAKLAKKQLNGRSMWTMTSVDYVNASVKNVEESIKKFGLKLPKRSTTPMSSAFVPELDGTAELDSDRLTLYQELIGVLRWATEIGRVDILHEVSILSQYQALPREGHLEEVLRIFAYLKSKPKLTLYFDPTLPVIDYGLFTTKRDDFKEFYRDAEEELPYRMPVPRGRPVVTTAFVDASHAANKVTRKSHTGYVIFINRSPTLWYSKRQQTIEGSTFSSEFIAMRACVEAIQHLQFKLRMFGVPLPLGEPTHVFCDNESVVKNCTRVESVL